jgi:CubicO group peptidase (beta-lactamase class C family)
MDSQAFQIDATMMLTEGSMRTHHWIGIIFMVVIFSGFAVGQPIELEERDSDLDGLPDRCDDCPQVNYLPGFDGADCRPMDLDPSNDPQPECKARERIAGFLVGDPTFITHIAFSVVKDGQVHFSDAFEYVGGGQYVHDPSGIHRLFKIGSTSKSVVAVTAKIMEERGEISLADFVSDDDATRVLVGGKRTLRHLLTHRGAFLLDDGAIHLYCYPGDLAEFWAEPDDSVSPHFDLPPYGNLEGGFEYSAFNYSLAGAYLAVRLREPFALVIHKRLFYDTGMCTATLDNYRAAQAPIGDYTAIAQNVGSMHVGPYINLVSPTDPLCDDNYYSSNALYGDPYTWMPYRLDEASAEARDPAGGVMASVVDMAHFAAMLLQSYHGTDGLLSPEGVRDLWWATSDLGCAPDCPYASYYGIGFFTEAQVGEPVVQCEHGGVRPGFTSAFVLRPEANLAVSILVNGNASSVDLSNLAKDILDDFTK